MFCERCQEREATVYVTLIAWPPGRPGSHEFCGSCHASAEAERVKAYNSQPSNPLPADVEHISALDYLEAGECARRNGVDGPAFKHIRNELSHLPATRERLAFEMLPLIWQSLEHGEEPAWQTSLAGSCWGSIQPGRRPEYTGWLEKIILRIFELRNEFSTPVGEHGPFSLSLSMMLIALGKVDRARFTSVVQTLKDRGGEARLDPRWRVIAQAEARISRPEPPSQLGG